MSLCVFFSSAGENVSMSLRVSGTYSLGVALAFYLYRLQNKIVHKMHNAQKMVTAL